MTLSNLGNLIGHLIFICLLVPNIAMANEEWARALNRQYEQAQRNSRNDSEKLIQSYYGSEVYESAGLEVDQILDVKENSWGTPLRRSTAMSILKSAMFSPE